MQYRACLRGDQRLPLAVDLDQSPPRGDPLIAQRQAALLGGDLTRDAEQGRSTACRGRRDGRATRGACASASGRWGRGTCDRTVLCARSKLGNTRLAGREVGSELLPLGGELCGARGNLLLCLGERALLAAQREPLTNRAHHATQGAERAGRRRGCRGVAALGGLVLLLHLLNALVDIAAGLQQVLVRLLHLILRKLQARLREIEPVLNGWLVGIGGLGELFGELLDAFRFARQRLLRIVEAVLNLARFRTEEWRVRLEVPQCGGEGEIELMIRGLHG